MTNRYVSCEGHASHGVRKMDPHTPRGGRDHAERLLPPPGYLPRLLVTDRTRDGKAAEGRADRESGAGFGVVARSGVHPGPPFPAGYAARHRHRGACLPNVQAKRGRPPMTQKQVDVWYRYQSITAKPLYISNDDVRRVAGDVRGQLVSAVDTRLTRDHLL